MLVHKLSGVRSFPCIGAEKGIISSVHGTALCIVARALLGDWNLLHPVLKTIDHQMLDHRAQLVMVTGDAEGDPEVDWLDETARGQSVPLNKNCALHSGVFLVPGHRRAQRSELDYLHHRRSCHGRSG